MSHGEIFNAKVRGHLIMQNSVNYGGGRSKANDLERLHTALLHYPSVMLSALPSGSLKNATLALPSGAVQMPSASWPMPS